MEITRESELLERLAPAVRIDPDGSVAVTDAAALRGAPIETLIRTAVFAPDAALRARAVALIRLIAPDYNLSYILAMPATAAFAREVVEMYGQTIGQHPVGTGAFRLKEWRRSSRVSSVVGCPSD